MHKSCTLFIRFLPAENVLYLEVQPLSPILPRIHPLSLGGVESLFFLSVKSGFRAKEIASLIWQMVTDPEGNIADAIALQNIASKGKNGGRTIPLNKNLKQALQTLKDFATAKRLEKGFFFDLAANVITSERGERLSANSVAGGVRLNRLEPGRGVP